MSDRSLIRAAFELVNSPAPLNEEEIGRRDARHAARRIGNTIRLTEQDMADQLQDAITAWSRSLQAAFPAAPAEQVRRIVTITQAMNAAGHNIGYHLGAAGRPWHEGLEQLRAAHPGFPADLYQTCLQRGTNQSFR